MGRFRDLAIGIVGLMVFAQAALPVSARAAEADADVFVVLASTQTGAVCWVLSSCIGGVGSPSLIAQAGGACQAVSLNAGDTTEAEVPGCTANVAGGYVNVFCGSGVMSGSAVFTEADGDGADFGSYTEALVNGIGVVAATGTGDAGDTVPAAGAGVVDILAQPNVPAATNSVCFNSGLVTIVLVSTA